MKKILFTIHFIMYILSFSSDIKTVDFSKLEKRENETFYLKGTDKLYTGRSTSYFENRYIAFEGFYKNGKRDGIFYWFQKPDDNGEYLTKNKYRNIVNFRDGKLHGQSIWFDSASGVIREEAYYKNGVLHGPYNSSYDDGRVQFKGMYVNGKVQGEFIRDLGIGTKVNGNLQGEYKSYYAPPNDEGGVDPYSECDIPNFNIRSIEYYIDNQLHGIVKEYFRNGQLRFEGVYNLGKKNGIFRLYFENGELEREEVYIDDKLHGYVKLKYKNGVLLKDNVYDNWNTYGNYMDSYTRTYKENKK